MKNRNKLSEFLGYFVEIFILELILNEKFLINKAICF